MDFTLNRRGGIPLRDQLRYQLELNILTGQLLPGQRLPSVRALARRLKLHPNTIAAAYKDLEATGHVEVHKGAGVFVAPSPLTPPAAGSLDDILRLALRQAFRAGHTATEIRAGVERWLGAALAECVVVVDAAREMAELLAEEVRQTLGIVTSSCTVVEVETRPSLVSGMLCLALPYHLEAVSRVSAPAALEPLTLQIPEDRLREVISLPSGSLIVLVSYVPTVLPFAEALLTSLRGDAVRVETRLLTASREWRPLVRLADLVLADACSIETVRGARPRRLRELRLVSAGSLDRLRPLAASLPAGRAPSHETR